MKPKLKSTTVTRTDIAAKPCAVYARFSPKPKGAVGENYSIESQLDACRELAERDFGCAIPDEFIDRNISGATLDRPELDRLRDAIAAKRYDAVIVHSPDRLSRDRFDSLLLRQEFAAAGVKQIFVSGSYEDSPEGELSYDIQSAVAQYERRKIAERTRRGRKRKAREGFHHSCPPTYGYRYLGHKFNQRGLLEIIPEQAAVVKRMFEMTARGASNYRVALTLNAEGIGTAKGLRWHRQSIAQTLAKTVYYGEKAGPAGIIVPAPPIVSRKLWDEAHAALARNRVALVGRPTRQYLLSGLLWCARCGARFGTHPKPGDEAVYRCRNIDGVTYERRCNASGIRKSRLEPVVWDAIWETITDPALLWKVIEAYHDQVAKPKAGKKDAAVARIERARRLLARAEAIFRDPDQPIPYEQAKRGLEAARRELVEAETARPAGISDMPARTAVAALARDFRQAHSELREADFDERRGSIQRVVEKIRYEAGNVEITCRIPLDSKANCNEQAPDDCNTVASFPFVINRRVAA